MAKNTPKESGAKVVIYSRIDPVVITALDEIAASMRPTPTRAQLIDVAVAEYVERHGKAAKRKSET
ncbi:MAG: hypothetical protein JWL69_4150 [Phycisphaerales bacterium]|nr:hypothetical protein [Phycisphaerales bacterium]